MDSNATAQLTLLREEFESHLHSAEDLDALEAVRVRFSGKKSALQAALKQMSTLSPEERPQYGAAVNDLRNFIQTAIQERKQILTESALAARLEAERFDVTRPGIHFAEGVLHPLSQVQAQICEVFMGMGFSIADGPEVELESYNFDLLRIPEDHPARDTQDTFYLGPGKVLRTQTSPVQIRVMQSQEPPLRIICPGRVYRSDTPDATHSAIFHQVEGLLVDEHVAMSDLVGVLRVFAKSLFGPQSRIRLRPHHFPFTEPSCEVDVSCWRCQGQAEQCSTCKAEGWIEILGAGMVHPQVLENCGIDSKKYSGYAFGIGVERTAMGRFGIEDIRYFYENDLRFLSRFR